MLSLKTIAHLSSKRLFSTLSNNVLEHLSNRTLIKISGSDVSNYLQGLITNDIEHLNSGPGSMYAVFLNTAGRVLYDTIIYRNLEKDTYLIECDKQVTDTLQKHLKLHRVRRKIDVINLTEELKIYALFNNETCEQIDNLQVSDGTASFRAHQDLLIYRDPRVASLGSRIITKTDINVHNQLSEVVNIKENESSGCSYRRLRYKLGVGEGIEDLPTGECFPLESNCDYLHGVSFHKGCYIGQELTARIHHTGVVRKRLMPIYFSKVPSKFPEKKIVQDNVNLGKLRGIEKDVGLALLKINDALATKQIKIGDGIGVTSRPNWWPAEAPKEKANISKLQ